MQFWSKFTFIILIFIAFILPIRDTDFGWHYRCGLDWLQSRQFCFENRYSYFLPNYFWGYSTLIYDVLLALIFNNWGFVGVTLALGILMASLFYLLTAAYSKSKTVLFSYLVLIAFGINVITIGFRPQILALICFLIMLIILNKTDKTQGIESLFLNLVQALIIVVWVNLHPSFIIGLIIYSIFALIKLLKREYIYLAFLSLVFLASLISPLGFRVYVELLNHYVTDLSKLIAEWTAPTFWQRIAIIASVALITFLKFKQSNKIYKITWFYFISLLLLAALSFSAKRHLPLYGLFLAVLLEETKLMSTLTAFLRISLRTLEMSVLMVFGLAAIVNIQVLRNINNYHKYYTQQAIVKLPYQISSYSSLLKGNLFTMYEWGGYFIWQLPKSKVFVDGRMPAWQTPSGKSPYTIYLEIIQAQPGWQKTLARYKTDAIVIFPGTFLDLELQKNSETSWRQVVRNQELVIYKKK